MWRVKEKERERERERELKLKAKCLTIILGTSNPIMAMDISYWAKSVFKM